MRTIARAAALAAIFVFCCGAQASYELMLVGDGRDLDVDRYDPVTGAYLGSLGKGYLASVSDVAVDPSSGRLYVADPIVGKVKIFDYSTGLYLGSFAPAGGSYFVRTVAGGDVVAGNYGSYTPSLHTPSGASLMTWQFPSGTYFEGAAQTADGRMWFVDGTQRLIVGSLTSTATSVSYTFSNFGLPAYLSASGQRLAYIDYQGFNGATKLALLRTSGNGVQSATSVVLPNSEALGTGTAFGHGDVVYGLTTDYGSSTSLYKWIPGEAAYRVSLSQTKGGVGIAIVVAPEPATVAALVAGVGALAMRRRRSTEKR